MGCGPVGQCRVLASDGRVLGTFALYHRDRHTPDAPEQAVATRAAHIAGIAIEREQATQTLRQLNQDLERRVAERTEALQTSEERWQLVLRGTNDGIWDWDLQTNKVFFSSRWKQMRGFVDAEISDSPEECLKRIHPEDYDRLMAAVDDHLAGRTEFLEIEYRTQRRDGSYMWVLDRAQAVRNAAGQAIRISGSEKDISDRKRMEAALAESEAKFRRLVEGCSDLVWAKDTEGRFTYLSPQFQTLFGWEPQDWIGKSFHEVVHPDDLPWMTVGFRQDIKSGKKSHPEFRHRHRDGHYIWVRGGATPILDAAGVVIGKQGILTDISDRKRMEAALAESEAKFRRLVEEMSDFIWAQDAEGRFTYLSPQFQTLFGWEPQDWIGKSFLELVHPDDLPWVTLDYQKDLELRQKSYPEFRHLRRDGHYIWVRVSATPLLDDEGVVIGKQGILTDISDLKQVEEELIRSRDLREAIFNESTDALFLVDPHTLLTVDCNQRALQLFEAQDKANLLGIEGHTLQRHRFSEQELAEIKADMRTQGFWSREVEYVTLQGQVFWGNLAAKSIVVAGRTVNLVRVTDISDRKRADIRLQQQANCDRLISVISQHIRASLNLQDILNTTVVEVHQVLQADRVLIYRILADGTGKPIAESVAPGWPVILDQIYPEEIFPLEIHDRYVQGHIAALDDCETGDVLPCLVDFLRGLQVRAKLVVPIVQNETLWGLLIAHQCSGPRSLASLGN